MSSLCDYLGQLPAGTFEKLPHCSCNSGTSCSERHGSDQTERQEEEGNAKGEFYLSAAKTQS